MLHLAQVSNNKGEKELHQIVMTEKKHENEVYFCNYVKVAIWDLNELVF